jgi:hypothetical protein
MLRTALLVIVLLYNKALELRVLLQKQIATSNRRSTRDLVQSSPLPGRHVFYVGSLLVW